MLQLLQDCDVIQNAVPDVKGMIGCGQMLPPALTDLDTEMPRTPRIAKDAEQVNAAELDRPDPAKRRKLYKPKRYHIKAIAYRHANDSQQRKLL